MTSPQEHSLLRSFYRLNRDVEQLKRRVSPEQQIVQDVVRDVAAGAGPWPWDYLISENYTGTEGAEQEAFGHTYKVYSTIQGAVTDANTNRQAANQDSSFFILPGTYIISSALSLAPPTLGGYHFYGSGQRETIIQAGAGSITLIQIGTPISDPVASFRDIGFSAGGFSSVTFIDFSIGMECVVENCWLQTGNGTGINGGLDTRASKIRHNLFDAASGSAVHIRLSGDFGIQITDNVFHSGSIAIDINNSIDLQINDNRFYSQDIGIRFAGNSFDSFTTVNDNLFWVGGKGIEFINGNQQGLTIENNAFDNIGSGEIGIDFDPMTAAICTGIDITGNIFSGSGSGIGIRGDVVNLFNSIASHNVFRNIANGNEIVNWNANGNEAYHNISTTSLGVKNPLADIGSPVGHSILSNSSAGEGISINERGIISVDDVHSGSRHHEADTTLLSGTFAIDSTGIKTITVPHSLGYIPATRVVQLTVVEETAVDDWSFDLLKTVSVDASNVVAKIRVNAASASGGATARLAILISHAAGSESVFFGWAQTPAILPTSIEQHLAYRNRHYGAVQAQNYAGPLTTSP